MLKNSSLTVVAGLALFVGCSSSSSNKNDAGNAAAGDGSASADGTKADGTMTTDGATLSDSATADAPATPDAPFADSSTADAAPVLTAKEMRGQYLMNNVVGCPDCHTPRLQNGAPDFTKYLSGWECFAKLPNGHCLNTRNLTSDATGLKNRTDADIKKMFMDGIRPAATGDTPLHPAMPYYVFHNMATEDADAIVAYLRTVPPVVHEVPRSGVEFEVPAAVLPIDPTTIPTTAVSDPNKASADRGRYLATQVGVCIECHTEHSMGKPQVLDPAKYFSGGEKFDLGLPNNPIARNITSDNDTGIGKWTVDDILTVLKEGKSKDGKQLCPPMPFGPMGPYGGLKAEDARDIANYIKSLPAKVNKVASMCVWPPGPPPSSDAGSDGATSADAGKPADAGTGG